MHIDHRNEDIFSACPQSQMRTAKNRQKIHRNYRSQIRSDAERRRGAP
jgi:hypothetical protein